MYEKRMEPLTFVTSRDLKVQYVENHFIAYANELTLLEDK
jgi:hypothetical protein